MDFTKQQPKFRQPVSRSIKSVSDNMSLRSTQGLHHPIPTHPSTLWVNTTPYPPTLGYTSPYPTPLDPYQPLHPDTYSPLDLNQPYTYPFPGHHPYTPLPTYPLSLHHPILTQPPRGHPLLPAPHTYPSSHPLGPHHPLVQFCVQFWSLLNGQGHLVLSNSVRLTNRE